MKLLVDTNVFLEYLLGREHADDVEDFIVDSNKRKNSILVSAMSLRDIGYAMQRYTHDWKKARDVQLVVYRLVTKVVSTSADSAIESLYMDWKDYEDCLQEQTAEENMCSAIITYNKQDYKNSNIPVYTPEEVVNINSSNI